MQSCNHALKERVVVKNGRKNTSGNFFFEVFGLARLGNAMEAWFYNNKKNP